MTHISFAVTAQLISAFVFTKRIVQSFFYLNPKFQASSHLLWLYSPVCVGPGWKPRRPVFSQRGSNHLPAQQRLRSAGASILSLSCALNTGTMYLIRILGGARWLSGRALDFGARGGEFETHLCHVVSLSKTLYSPKVLVIPGKQWLRPDMTEKLLTGM